MKNILNQIFQNAREPKGFLGRIILAGMNKGNTSRTLWGLSKLKWEKDWHVLDIGCGGGATVSRILKLSPDGKVFGIDISIESIKFASRKNKKELGKRCYIEQGNANKLPYEKEKFNVVTAFSTIYFWDNLNRSFSDIYQILKQNGYFLICCEISDPNDTTWTSRINGMKTYSSDQLKDYLQECGFINVEIYKQNKENICVVAQKGHNLFEYSVIVTT